MPSGPAASPIPLEVIEQITYLLFIKRLDDLHTLEENKAATLKLKKLRTPRLSRRQRQSPATPRPYDDLRWSRFKHFEADGNVRSRRSSTSSRSCARSAATTPPTRIT